MIKTLEVIEAKPDILICKFNNGETRRLDLNQILKTQTKDIFLQIIIEKNKNKTVKIGEFGQLCWENAAHMKDLDGKSFECEYDMSAEIVYHNSTLIA